MTYPIRRSTPASGLLQLEINRPERRNALNAAAYEGLIAGLADAAADDAVRVVVLTGAERCFTSGNDIADFMTRAEEPGGHAAIRFLRAIASFDKPVVAAVEGFAIGIGTTMLLHCDLAYAGRSARFKLPFVPLGICAEGAWTLLLPQVAGAKRASEMLLLGEEFSGDAAARDGLVNEAVEDGQALPRALERAAALAALPAPSVLATKALLQKARRAAALETIAAEAAEFDRLRRLPETQARFAAFMNKG
jgi:enoyl-CoA hydratase/carnithine racemase